MFMLAEQWFPIGSVDSPADMKRLALEGDITEDCGREKVTENLTAEKWVEDVDREEKRYIYWRIEDVSRIDDIISCGPSQGIIYHPNFGAARAWIPFDYEFPLPKDKQSDESKDKQGDECKTELWMLVNCNASNPALFGKIATAKMLTFPEDRRYSNAMIINTCAGRNIEEYIKFRDYRKLVFKELCKTLDFFPMDLLKLICQYLDDNEQHSISKWQKLINVQY